MTDKLYRVVDESKWRAAYRTHNKRVTDKHGWLWVQIKHELYRSVATGEMRVWMRSEMKKVNGDRKGLPRN